MSEAWIIDAVRTPRGIGKYGKGALSEDAASRSNTSVCLKVIDARVAGLPEDAQAEFAKKLASLLEKEGVALDVGGYRDAPPGLRIWCGATVETSDLDALTPWLDWAFASVAEGLAAPGERLKCEMNPCPASSLLTKGAGLVLPLCNTETMTLHLTEIALAVAPGAHAVILMDQAGWHMTGKLDVPDNISIIALPAKCPELNPVENIWQFMRDNWLSNRVFTSHDNIVDLCCEAWNKLIDQPWRIMTIGHRKWAS
eukprot:gene36870-49731_t